MPELPEVETVCRGLNAARLRTPVRRVWRSALDLRIGAYWARAQEGSRRLLQRSPGQVRRRGKYILWPFTDQENQELVMVVHLGMTGALQVHPKGAPVADHTHLQMFFEDGRRVDYIDPRRFGGFRVDEEKAHQKGPLGKLGPEPLSAGFDGEYLKQKLGTRKIAIRDALLNQKIVAGVGNIYAVEALFESSILPTRSAATLSTQECQTLVASIQRGLRQAIKLGGTTLRDYRGADGQQGKNQARLGVYGRESQDCPRCGAQVRRENLGGRSAFFCPGCQN